MVFVSKRYHRVTSHPPPLICNCLPTLSYLAHQFPSATNCSNPMRVSFRLGMRVHPQNACHLCLCLPPSLSLSLSLISIISSRLPPSLSVPPFVSQSRVFSTTSPPCSLSLSPNRTGGCNDIVRARPCDYHSPSLHYIIVTSHYYRSLSDCNFIFLRNEIIAFYLFMPIALEK